MLPNRGKWFGILILAGLYPISATIAAEPAATAAPAASPASAPAATLDAHGRWVIAADFARDGGTLVTAGGESLLYKPGDVVVWKADGTRDGELTGHPTAVWAVKISRDGRLAATAGYDGLVKLWDFPSRKLKADLRKQKGWVRSLDISPDGSRLATAGEDGSVVIWDTASGKELAAIAAHSGSVGSVAFAPDGSTLATGGGDSLVKMWDVASGAEKAKLEGHGDAVWSVVFSPDGSLLATTSADRTVRLWTTSDSKPQVTLSGHKDWVTSAGFSPDGTRLATGSLDGVVKFWDVKAKAEQEGLAAQKSSVWCLAFAPDAQTLFVGTHSGGRRIATPAPKLIPVAAPAVAAAQPPAASPPAAPKSVEFSWKPLLPTEFKSMANATGTISAEGVVMVGGSLAKDTYTLKTVVPAGCDLKAIRLEPLADPSLPSKGPGRAGNGNFIVSTFAVLAQPAAAGQPPIVVRFGGAKADHEQSNYPLAAAIDDKSETGWGIGGAAGKDHSAIFTLAPDVVVPAGATLTITIDQQYADGQHALGKFRIAAGSPGPSKPDEKKPDEKKPDEKKPDEKKPDEKKPDEKK